MVGKNKIVIAIGLVMLTLPGTAGAQDKAAGMQIAKSLCARCHAIAPGEIGLHPLAPTFQDVARRYSVWDLQEALAEGILVGHASMPKFKLKPKEIGDLLTYMDALPKLPKQAQ